MTAVIYARYSSDNQRKESIEGQIRECTAYAEKNGITIVKHYIDRAISAKTDNRPEFQQMIKDSERGIFDIIIVWKLDMSLKDQRQALVDTFINAIYLYDDKVLITFNYKEGTQTVTFGEASEVASEGNGSDLDRFAAPRKTSTHCVLVFLFRCGRGLEQQRRRPQPAAETGRSCWGRVLIFQSPAKGLQKNQQTQPVRP